MKEYRKIKTYMNPFFSQDLWVLVILVTRAIGISELLNSKQQFPGAMLYCTPWAVKILCPCQSTTEEH